MKSIEEQSDELVDATLESLMNLLEGRSDGDKRVMASTLLALCVLLLSSPEGASYLRLHKRGIDKRLAELSGGLS